MQYNEVLSNELDFEKINEEIQIRRNQGMHRERVNPFFVVFKEWKKLFKEKNLKLSMLTKQEREKIYERHFGLFFQENKKLIGDGFSLGETNSIEPGVPQKEFMDIYW